MLTWHVGKGGSVVLARRLNELGHIARRARVRHELGALVGVAEALAVLVGDEQLLEALASKYSYMPSSSER